MSVWAIVPVKPLSRAKSRLAGVLSAEQRQYLATQLLLRTVRLLLPLPHIQGVLVISRDTQALAMARDLGAQTVQESGAPELNNALLRATQASRVWGSEAVLVVPADIPLLSAEDIGMVVDMGRYHNSVVLVPDRREQGTNLLLVRPPGIIPYAFGENSFNRHQYYAREAGATVLVHRSESASLDIDTPDDLARYGELAKALGEPIIERIGPVGVPLSGGAS
ncbi:MAG: 2-phospho-L-lactate guanylyltransferase [Chloroflexota bacterium]|jgi:2-phospho-L-lactate guanylyltransferase